MWRSVVPRLAGALLVVALSCLVASPVGSAEVVPGQPDESIQQAYPIGQGTTYSGAFDNTNYADVDYLAFDVTSAGQTLEFTIANTTRSCNDPNDAGCPLYATLMDSSDQQVGGNRSAAGTIATNGDTEIFDWTFASPGTYYLLMESNGDLTPGNPTYSVEFGPPAASGGSGSGGGGSGAGSGGTTLAPIVRSLTVRPRQHGLAVIAGVLLGRPHTSLVATLFAPGQHPRFVGRLQESDLSAGMHRLTLKLSALYRMRLKRRHRLSLEVKLTATVASGQHVSLSKPVVLSR